MVNKIGPNSQVEMHFDLRLKDGSVAESTQNIGRPMPFTMGTGVFSDKLETALLGMQKGEKKKVMLLPDEAFGPVHPANVYQVPKQRFDGLDNPLEEGLIVSFSKPNGEALPGIIRAIDDSEVTVDFNHPLAGQVVLFDLEIISVDEAVA